MVQPKPAAEVALDAARVRELLAHQHPDLATLPIRPVAEGWDNAIFRLGDALAVRLPRRALAAGLVANEQRWLPELAPRLPLPVPVPVRIGAPGRGYPWRWSVCPWLDGRSALEASPEPGAAARDLGAFLAALHVPAPEAAPHNPVRGVALTRRSEALESALARLGQAVDAAAIRDRWAAALAAPPAPGRWWIHGDLHPGNLLVRDGRLSAVLDFGDLAGGDPATDLAVAWMLFDAPWRPTFREAAASRDREVDDAAWARARGWALALAVAFLAHSADDPTLRAVGARTLARVLDEPDRPHSAGGGSADEAAV